MLIGFKLEPNQREKVTFEFLRRQATPEQLAADDEYPALTEGCLE